MNAAKRTKLALDESRMLMLGVQIFLGVQLEVPFQAKFDDLAMPERIAAAASLLLTALCIALLITPSARHRIVDRGQPTIQINTHIGNLIQLTLIVLAVTLSLTVYLVARRILGPTGSALLGVAVLCGSIVLWFSPLAFERYSQMPHPRSEKASPAELVEFALTESRVVLPGVQALLGFQFVIIFSERFDSLDSTNQITHLAALLSIAVAGAILIAPAAYHRMVYHGEAVPRLYDITATLNLIALAFLAVGMSLDIAIVSHLILGSPIAGLSLGGAIFIATIVLWYLWPAHVARTAGKGS